VFNKDSPLCFAFDVKFGTQKHEYLVSVPFQPSFELGEFSRREKGACPLKMHLGNFVRNLPFYFSFDLLFVF